MNASRNWHRLPIHSFKLSVDQVSLVRNHPWVRNCPVYCPRLSLVQSRIFWFALVGVEIKMSKAQLNYSRTTDSICNKDDTRKGALLWWEMVALIWKLVCWLVHFYYIFLKWSRHFSRLQQDWELQVVDCQCICFRGGLRDWILSKKINSLLDHTIPPSYTWVDAFFPGRPL